MIATSHAPAVVSSQPSIAPPLAWEQNGHMIAAEATGARLIKTAQW